VARSASAFRSWVAIVCLSWWHNVGEDNGDAHLKRSVMGREVIVAVTNGKLDFGPWDQIFYGELDGGRKKRVLVKIIGE
jgi:secondary thiamine-phosphate synthase enzyme